MDDGGACVQTWGFKRDGPSVAEVMSGDPCGSGELLEDVFGTLGRAWASSLGGWSGRKRGGGGRWSGGARSPRR